jgi:serine/threonine protein kinase
MPLAAGDKLGPYEILAPLGAGAMGEVYRARDTRLGREVALKILPAEVAGDSSRRQRFEQEARAVAALNHPNIVAVYDVAFEDRAAFIVSELVQGETLRAVIQRGPAPWRKALDIAVQTADGLAAAHAAHIAHRDLKPENIMLTADGRVKILDFGLAKPISRVFVFVFTVACLLIATPLLAAKFLLGRHSRLSPPDAAGAVALESGLTTRWNATGALAGLSRPEVASLWRTFLSSPLEMGAWHLAFLSFVGVISAGGVSHGIEVATKVPRPSSSSCWSSSRHMP